MTAIAITEGHVVDLAEVAQLVARASLPLDGLSDRLQFVIARSEPSARMVGCAALEEYAGGVLLRSVVIDEPFRGQGLGERLTRAALNLASRRGHRAAYLLTTTAAGFFPRFGFERISRDQVPDDVRGSVEFISACPSTAVAMRADLRNTRLSLGQ